MHDGHHFIHFPVCYKCPQWMLTHRSPAGFVLIQILVSDFCIVEYINYCIYSKVWVYHLKKVRKNQTLLKILNVVTPRYTTHASLWCFRMRGMSFELVPICQKQLINPSCMLYPVLYWLDGLRRLLVSAPNTLMLNRTVREDSNLSHHNAGFCVCVYFVHGWVSNAFDQPQRY